jgi:hypothetical protein
MNVQLEEMSGYLKQGMSMLVERTLHEEFMESNIMF